MSDFITAAENAGLKKNALFNSMNAKEQDAFLRDSYLATRLELSLLVNELGNGTLTAERMKNVFELSKLNAFIEYALINRLASVAQTDAVNKKFNDVLMKAYEGKNLSFAEISKIAMLGTGEGKTYIVTVLLPVLQMLNAHEGKMSFVLADTDINIANLYKNASKSYGNLYKYRLLNEKSDKSAEIGRAHV